MTDRVNSLTVALKEDMRDDDVQALMDAIQQFSNVLEVSKNVSDPQIYTAERRAKHEITNKLLAALDD